MLSDALGEIPLYIMFLSSKWSSSHHVQMSPLGIWSAQDLWSESQQKLSTGVSEMDSYCPSVKLSVRSQALPAAEQHACFLPSRAGPASLFLRVCPAVQYALNAAHSDVLANDVVRLSSTSAFWAKEMAASVLELLTATAAVLWIQPESCTVPSLCACGLGDKL